MVELKQKRKTYSHTQFGRVLQSKVTASAETGRIRKDSFKKDDSDLLIYLITVKYMMELINQGSKPGNDETGNRELTLYRIENAHKLLMKKYKG
jgi:hypothetical protein